MMHASRIVLSDLPTLPRDEEGPVFQHPWEAHAFALAVRLAEAGCFSLPEWTAFLSREIHSSEERRDPNTPSSSYEHWLRALEQLCVDKGLVNFTDLQRRKEEWRRAYWNTPHGQPVELSAAGSGAKLER